MRVFFIACFCLLNLSAPAQSPPSTPSPPPWIKLFIVTDPATADVYATLLDRRFDSIESLMEYIATLPVGTRIQYLIPIDVEKHPEWKKFSLHLGEIKELCQSKGIRFWIRGPYY